MDLAISYTLLNSIIHVTYVLQKSIDKPSLSCSSHFCVQAIQAKIAKSSRETADYLLWVTENIIQLEDFQSLIC